MRFRALPLALAAGFALVVTTLAACEPSTKTPAAIESTAPPSADAVLNLVGPGCAAYTKKYATGAGSVATIADQGVASAIEEHPELKKFAAAISGGLNPQVNLVDELNGGEFTVFAPTDKAFEKLPKKALDSLAQADSADALTNVLLYHLVVGERTPDAVAGDVETRGGQKLKITKSGERIRVGNANVVCGGLRTANATIYLIDSVLMPPNGSPTPSPTPTSSASASQSSTPTPAR